MQQRRIIVSGTITLLSVVRDSDVRVNDTEVGRGTPLTSPFIEGIYGNGSSAFCQVHTIGLS